MRHLKIFSTNKETESAAITLPKVLRLALQWKVGDKVTVRLGRDRSLIIEKVEHDYKEGQQDD